MPLDQITKSMAFWIGSLIPVVVALLSNYLADRKARKERDLSLRRDIYLAAIEAASSGMAALARLALSDTPETEVVRSYIEKAPSITKVYLVAKIEAITAFTKFRDELEAALARAARSRGKELRHNGQKLSETLGTWQKDADRLGQLFTSVLVLFRSELGMSIKELELHRVFDESRRIRLGIVEEAAKLLNPKMQREG